MQPTHLSRRSSFRARSEDALREIILGGGLHVGQRLNEVELAASLGISRGPLREAVQRLAAEGLLSFVEHRGAYVRSFSAVEVQELYDVRAVLESAAARWAAERAEMKEVDKLRASLEATRALLDKEEFASYPRDVDFHSAILELADNRMLSQHAKAIGQQLQLVRARSGSQPKRARQAYAEHSVIVEAIANRDADAAAALMREHIGIAMRSAQFIVDSDAAATVETERVGNG